jgi:Zn-dependent protease with chaperone function
VRSRTIDEIETLATSLRKRLGIDDCVKLDIVSVLEFELHRFLPEFEFVVVEDKTAAPSVLAFARSNPPQIAVRESIYRQAISGDSSARFVLAHELGHLMLRHGIAHKLSAGARMQRQVQSLELEANKFAAAFLVPGNAIENLTPDQISSTFGVSNQVARLRLAEQRTAKRGALPSPFMQLLEKFHPNKNN